MYKVFTDDGYLGKDILRYARNLGEEEERKYAGNASKACPKSCSGHNSQHALSLG